jgi:O-antigen/teichoic acid export membrane protein
MVKRNILANYIGQGWTALMGIAFVPMYIAYLGIESYALIGLFTLVSNLMNLLDFGLTPALSREMAMLKSGQTSPQFARNLLRTIECFTGIVASLLIVGFSLISNYCSSSLLNDTSLPSDTASLALLLICIAATIRLFEGVYRGCLIGLQHQVALNGANLVLSTLRAGGAVAILAWFSPTIIAFFIWQLAISSISILTLAILLYRNLPAPELSGRFSTEAILSVWRFAYGMILFTSIAVLLTQIDKAVLFRLLSLEEYGYYALASNLASSLFMLVTPVTQAIYPRLCELHAAGQLEQFQACFHKGARLVTVISGSAAAVIFFFSDSLLSAWTQNADLASRVAPTLSLLIAGNALNGFLWTPHLTQLSVGWTGLAVRTNLLALVGFIPAIVFAAHTFGQLGVAYVWIALNAGLLIFVAHIMFRKILRSEKTDWYLWDILIPLVAAVGTCLSVRALVGYFFPCHSLLTQILEISFASILSIAASGLVAGLVSTKVLFPAKT